MSLDAHAQTHTHTHPYAHAQTHTYGCGCDDISNIKTQWHSSVQLPPNSYSDRIRTVSYRMASQCSVLCIDMHYSQDERDKHRKPLSAGRTVLGLVITEADRVNLFCDMHVCVCVCVCVDVHVCERENSVTLVTGQSSIQIPAGAIDFSPL